MLRYYTVSGCFVLTFLTSFVSAQDTVRTIVKFNTAPRVNELVQASQAHADAAQAESNLCRELIATKAAAGTLVGVTKQGNAVIDTPHESLPRLLESRVVASASAAALQDTKVIPITELILTYEAGNPPTEAELEQAGLRVVKNLPKSKGTFLVVEPITTISDKTATALQKNERVVRAELNYKAKADAPARKTSAHATSNQAADPIISDARFVDGSLWGVQAINAPGVWGQLLAPASKEVIVAVIDSGIDYNHEDLKDNIWTNLGETGLDAHGNDRATNHIDDDGNHFVDDVHGFDFFRNAADPMDRFGHGTHVAGTIAAVRNQIGVIGINWRVKLMALKYLDEEGENGSDTAAIAAIDYAIANGAKVLNFSTSEGGGEHSQYVQAIQRARDDGLLVVAAAGNADLSRGETPADLDETPYYPASFGGANVIAVLSVSRRGVLSDFSNYGARSVHIGAPGGNARGPSSDDILSTVPNNAYDYKIGTSMATPHVSGAVALMYGLDRYQQNFADGLPRVMAIRNDLLGHVQGIGLSGKCVSGGLLDLSFLRAELLPPPKAGPAAHATFGHGEKTATGIVPTIITQARIHLDKPMEVHIRADTTVTCNTTVPTKFILALCADTFPPGDWLQQPWLASQRVLTIDSNTDSRLAGTCFADVLPAGDHDIYLFVGDIKSGRGLAPGATLTFGAGCLMVDSHAAPGQ
jgi:subtilisin family serine protease